MSQITDIICDRCERVIKGTADNGAGPHWSLSFHSTVRKVKRGVAFDSLSWDLCADCAVVVAKVLVEEAKLKPSPLDWQRQAREMLGV